MEFVTLLTANGASPFSTHLNIPQIELLGIPIHAVTERQCVSLIIESLRKGNGGWVVTPNVDHLRRCYFNSEYARTVRRANLCVPDGMPLIWASKLQGAPLPERVTGSNLIFSLSRALGTDGRSVFLLGGEPGMADAAAGVLKKISPGLNIVGTCCPEIGFENDPSQIWEISRQLEVSKPDVVFVGLGSPKQEYVMTDFNHLLPHSWWLGVGISFSFACGRIKRAPPWMQRCGLEWMYRLCQEPRRLARRYLVDDFPFIFRLFRDAWVKRNGEVSWSIRPSCSPWESPSQNPDRLNG
jgi:N-acetylglucosaminyldiphosphoundecaprenol N-acetyl-beta-D-mannosaminyltransferase